LLHTILHRTDLIVFPLTLQTITTAPMMSIWGKGGRSNDPTNPTNCQSTEGSSGPKDQASIPPGPPHHVTILQHTIYIIQWYTKYTYAQNESKHSEMGPVRQNPIQRTVRSVHMRAVHCAQLLHTTLRRSDPIIFVFTLHTIIIGSDVSTRGKGGS